MTVLQASALLGGVGLFLLGMWLMTDGLRLAAGGALRDLLARSTSTRWRALGSGVLLTAVVQSSTAVTVAAIGFVNAGLLSLSQVLWVLFGSNVGTTVTGWLVALLGLKIKIDLLALPLIGAGMLLRLAGGDDRRGNVGLALAGFGVLFLGIDVLRDAFTELASGVRFPAVEGALGVALHVLIGALLTVLMQSSSAATALILTAAQGGLLGLESAAAVVIGSNIGTTVTALVAALGASANAKRAATAHLLFNVLTASVALLALPWLLGLTQRLGGWTGEPAAVATLLALFHTIFNLLGVVLMWPLSDRLGALLEKCFRSSEEDEGRARYLDAATALLPALAIEALSREVDRLGSIALRAAAGVAPLRSSTGHQLARTQRTLTALDAGISDFVVRLNRAAMTQENARRLSSILRRASYCMRLAEQLPTIAAADRELPANALPPGETLAMEVSHLREAAASLLMHLADGAGECGLPDAATRATLWEAKYQQLKADLLQAGALGTLTPGAMALLLRSHSALRRAVQQATKSRLAAVNPGNL